MPDELVTRRTFVALAGAAQAGAVHAAAQNTQSNTQQREPVVTDRRDEPVPRTAAGVIRIATTHDFSPAEIEQLEAAAPGTKVEITVAHGRDELREKLRDAEVLYGDPTGSDLDFAPKLRWAQAGAAGMEWMDEELRKSPVVLTNMARIFAPAISETAIGLLLCLTRGITKYYMPQFYRHQMKPVGTVESADHVELAGKVMGIVGMGGMGSAIARRAHYGFDMRVVGTDAKPMAAPEYVSELHDPGWFHEMVPQVDVLVAAAPLTPLTRRMFDERVFRSMKNTGYFLAMSRGGLFDDMALVRALKENRIAGAGMDVFPQEPPPPDHPIYTCQNAVMTAHTSGWSPDRQVRLIELFAENIRRYANGLPLMNVVDKRAGY